jgi:hypothetical protein
MTTVMTVLFAITLLHRVVLFGRSFATAGIPADAELQLITGHAKRDTLAIYQHVCLDGQERHQKAMREVET